MPKGACLFHQGVYIGHDSKKVYLAPRVRLLDQAGNTGGCNHMGSNSSGSQAVVEIDVHECISWAEVWGGPKQRESFGDASNPHDRAS